MAEGVRVELVDGIAVIRLSRPQVLNALDLDGLRALQEAIDRHGRGTDGLVLTGDGRAFSSGDDLKATDGIDRDTFARVIDGFQEVTRAIMRTDVAVVAAVNGIAVGGAAEIVCACDVRVGGPATEFLFPENGLGLTISNGSTVTLPALTGRRALALVLLGQRIGPDRAVELGLLDVVVSKVEDVVPEAIRVASALSGEGAATPLHLQMLRPPTAVIERALEAEREAAMEAWDRGLPQAGIRRFLETRR